MPELMELTSTRCLWCGSRVAYAFTAEGLGLDPHALDVRTPEGTVPVAWCSGLCARQHFQSDILEIARLSLTPGQYTELTTKCELPKIAPAIMDTSTPAAIRRGLQEVARALLMDRITVHEAKALIFALQTALTAARGNP